MRDQKIDLMRCIGILAIFLAHSNPPALIFQLRNFDVPLMVLVSGMSFGLSFKNESYHSYLIRRFKRLILPTWCFLTFYFSILFFFNLPPDKDILESYLLVDGIGYVWIIRVFLLVALVSPLIFALHKKIKSNVIYLLILFLVLAAFELTRFFGIENSPAFINLSLFYLIPYSAVFAFGLRLPCLSKKTNGIIVLVLFSCFLFLAIIFNFTQTQGFKYPPHAYYFSYALLVSTVIYILSGRIWNIIGKSSILKKFVLFISYNSLWFYLWQIPFARSITANFAIKFVLLVLAATLITYFHIRIKSLVLTFYTITAKQS